LTQDIYPQLIAARAAQSPDRVTLQMASGEEMTYRRLWVEGRSWASAFAQLGVGHGDTVVQMRGVGLDYFASWLGLTLLRAIDVSINTEYRGDLLAHVLTNSQAQVLVLEAQYLDRLMEVRKRVPTLETVVVLQAAEDLPLIPGCRVLSGAEALSGSHALRDLQPAQPWDIPCILYTSGTTGPSKGVVIPWGHLYRQARNFIPIETLNEDDVFYLPLVTYHLGGKVTPYLAAMLNARGVVRERFSPHEFWSDIERHGCTTTTMVGAMIPWVSASAPQRNDSATSLRNVIMAPVPSDVDAFRDRFGVRVGTAYSMTELSNPFGSDGWTACNENHQSCGRLKPGFEVRIVDEFDREVLDGEVGELIVRTDEPWTMNLGYYGMPAESFTAWRNGWFHTGDGFVRDAEGNYYFRDRLKDAIRRRGENISSFEVEWVVNQHPEVTESAAIAVPSEHTEDEVMVLVRRIDASELRPDELLEFLVPRMPRFMVPRYIEFVDELPKTPTDRIRKQELRQRGTTKQTWDREAAGIEVPR
jgi:crotonobetaine/carnitine-CoA ligase